MSKYREDLPEQLVVTDADLRVFSSRLFRIVFAASPHVLEWGALREFGPVPLQRWDPQPAPTGEHPGVGVLYTATSLQAVLAEVFQATRRIDVVSDVPVLLAWTPTRPLTLLDLGAESAWLIRHGAAAALVHGPVDVCQRWAAAIHAAYSDLDGLFVPSTMFGANVVLFQHARDAFPATPEAQRPLRDPFILQLVQHEAEQIGFPVDVPL